MIVWFTEWLSKPRHWVAYLMEANFAVWVIRGLLVI